MGILCASSGGIQNEWSVVLSKEQDRLMPFLYSGAVLHVLHNMDLFAHTPGLRVWGVEFRDYANLCDLEFRAIYTDLCHYLN